MCAFARPARSDFPPSESQPSIFSYPDILDPPKSASLVDFNGAFLHTSVVVLYMYGWAVGAEGGKPIHSSTDASDSPNLETFDLGLGLPTHPTHPTYVVINQSINVTHARAMHAT